jgi:hypothetical protein
MILKLIFCISQAANVSPYITQAVVHVESSFKADAVGAVGEQGLMQLRPEYFGADELDLFDPEVNLTLGVQNLRRLKEQCRDVAERSGWKRGWVICHNTGPTGGKRLQEPHEHEYLKKVKRAYYEYKAQRVFEHKVYTCD